MAFCEENIFDNDDIVDEEGNTVLLFQLDGLRNCMPKMEQKYV